MNKLDMFQSRFGKNRQIWMVGFRKNFRRCKEVIYLDRVQRIIPNSRSSFDVSGSGTLGNERISRSDMENGVYNCTLSYDTC